jgi:hypothetical protein
MTQTVFHLVYVNWKGERRERAVAPSRLFWGSTEWHPEPQWLVEALDVEKQTQRTFALTGFTWLGQAKLRAYFRSLSSAEVLNSGSELGL